MRLAFREADSQHERSGGIFQHFDILCACPCPYSGFRLECKRLSAGIPRIIRHYQRVEDTGVQDAAVVGYQGELCGVFPGNGKPDG